MRSITIFSKNFLRVFFKVMSRDGGSGYRMYVFKESTRRCTIDRKGRGCKEVIYLRVADVRDRKSVV